MQQLNDVLGKDVVTKYHRLIKSLSDVQRDILHHDIQIAVNKILESAEVCVTEVRFRQQNTSELNTIITKEVCNEGS